MNWFPHSLTNDVDANASVDLADSKTWSPIRILKGTKILINPLLSLVNGILWITFRYKGKDYHMTQERFKETEGNYLTTSLADQSHDISNYLNSFDSKNMHDYISLIEAASSYLKEAREYGKEKIMTNSDIAESFKVIMDVNPETLEYKLEGNMPFFSQYDGLRNELEPKFREYVNRLITNQSKDNIIQLEKIILGVYDFARKVNMNGPGYHGVKDGSIEIYMKLKKMHES